MIGLELVLISAAASLLLWLAWRRVPESLVRPNHQGRLIPVVLGLIVASGAAVGVSIVALERAARSGRIVITGRVVAVTVALAIVFTVGLIDDLTHGGPRGLRAHFAALLDRRPSTGLLKVIGAVGAAVLVVVVLPNHSALERGLGAILMAGCANLWNGLDVAPGRAAKVFMAAGAGVLIAGPAWSVTVPLLALYGAEIPAAWLDLREQGMLGDAGANTLGFALGAGMYTVLPTTWALALVTGAVVVVNVVAETVTISRVIDATPPLRWLDRAGRPKKSATER